MKQRPFWFLFNIYGWTVLAMSVATAFIVGQAWIVLLGVIGYQLALLVDLLWGRSLGRTGAIRLAQAEQENRELRAEQARLMGAIRERDERIASSKIISPSPQSPLSPVSPQAEETEGEVVDEGVSE